MSANEPRKTDYPIEPIPEQQGLVGRLIRFCMTSKLVVLLFVVFVVFWAIRMAPFDWNTGWFPRDPVPVDAIPDIGEKQQIVFTDWPGRSPRDVEDQVTNPLTRALQGVPEVKTIRGVSDFGFSSIYILFDDKADFYASRTRVLEKLNSLPADTLPPGVQPMLGPDATALGQIFWYTLEGRDPDGKPAGGWDLEELRTIQDWTVRYGLYAEGVSEVASVGGFVREYQVDIDPDAMRAYGVTVDEILRAVQGSNIDVGAKVVEVNRVEYIVRGVGFIRSVEDLENSVIKANQNVPIRVREVAKVTLGPELRRGALDKGGAEAVGGVVVTRYGSNPLAVIKNVKERIEYLKEGLPTKAVIDMAKVSPEELRRFAEDHGFSAYHEAQLNQEGWMKFMRETKRGNWPVWATTSQVTVVPFYDRTGLIHETLGTLNDALFQEMLITAIVIIIMVMHLRSSLLISMVMPVAVGMTFIIMKFAGVDANIVSLSGIAIAIGAITDMGIVICENILRHLEKAPPDMPRLEVIHRAASEVGSAVISACSSTIISFIPIFWMTGPEGRLFKPLAFTKTFALVSSIIIAVTVIPPFAHVLFTGRIKATKLRLILYGGIVAAGVLAGIMFSWWAGMALILVGLYSLVSPILPPVVKKISPWLINIAAAIFVGLLLTVDWEPLGPERGMTRNIIFVFGLIVVLMSGVLLFQKFYPYILRFCLAHKALFLSIPVVIVLMGLCIWLGFGRIFGVVPKAAEKIGIEKEKVYSRNFWVWGSHTFPGLGKEFMPPLDEGSYLYMPTIMAHASIGQALEVLATQDMALQAIPEIDSVVGKIGRADTAIDPAPISMIETVINYKDPYLSDESGRRINFRFDPDGSEMAQDVDGKPLLAPDGRSYIVAGRFMRDDKNRLIEDSDGRPFRQWRPALDPKLNQDREAWPGINSPDDIWQQIIAATELVGATSAPKLQPIAARIVMLQSGMRSPMGVKIYGRNLEEIEEYGLQIERFLKEVPSIERATVVADRIVGKPYIEIVPDRPALARYGIPIRTFQNVVEYAIGGERVTTTVEGRERFPVRIRYYRELRDQIETIGRVLVPASLSGSAVEDSQESGGGMGASAMGSAAESAGGEPRVQVPLSQLAEIRYVRGPQMIKSEDTFLTGYVLFDKKPGMAEVDVVEEAEKYLQAKKESGELVQPPGVISKEFAGTYKNQVHAQRTLMVMVPVALFTILIILYFQFRSVLTSLMVFFGVMVAGAGGFLMIWLYGQDWFLNFSLLGVNMRELFQVHPVNLSVAVWVGFLALFGIADDDGVVMGTFLDQTFRERNPKTVEEIREAVEHAGRRRIRACLMTGSTTILALIPVFTSTGRGADIMIPMALPSMGGMTIELMTMLIVPVLYCLRKEWQLAHADRSSIIND